MATVSFAYSFPGGNGYVAHDTNLTLTYDPNAQNPDGSYTVTAASGTYVTAGNNTHNITGLVDPAAGLGNNNHIFFTSSGHTVVDGSGIAFSVNDNTANHTANGSGQVRLYYGTDQNVVGGGTTTYREAGVGATLTPNPTNPAQPAAATPANPAPCYVTGTRIRVLRGLTIQDVPVERLRVGDLALTAAGKPRPIRWIGTRRYPGLTAPRHDRPVRIKASALHDGVPARDLSVSPDHCLWLDGLLVAAGHLVNGTSITRGEAVADLTYWHVELDSHDMLLAEGAAAESFLAAPGVRAGFDGHHRPDVAAAPVPFAERVEDGLALEALCDRIVARAGLSIEPIRFGTVRAWMDKCDGRRVAGWAQDAAHPDAPMCLDIVVDGAVVAMTLAEAYRADIAAAGVGDGRHGFDVDLDEPLAKGVAHTVEVRRSADSAQVCAMAVDAAGVWTALLAA